MIPIAIEKPAPRILKITWDDHVSSYYPLEFLRRKCPCASCNEARHSKPAASNPLRILQSHEIIAADLDLLEAEVVGRYALSFKWTDGHREGIYTFGFLRNLAEDDACRMLKSQFEK